MTQPATISADYTLRPSELAATLALLVEARQPAMVWGPPGSAKSMIAQQVAADGGREYVDVRALLLDPVDLRGIPWRDATDRTRWAPPVFLPPTDDTGLWLINLEDPRQLPPIGAGRPFVDICRKLAPPEQPPIFPRLADGYAELTMIGRQRGTGRGDVLLARQFSGDPLDAGADEVWDALNAGTLDHVRSVRWAGPSAVEEALTAALVSGLNLTGTDDEPGFEQSLGGSDFNGNIYFWAARQVGGKDGAASSSHNWQILSPIRAGLAGVEGLNLAVQRRFRDRVRTWAEEKRWAKIPKPSGPQGLLWGDKVINVRNNGRRRTYPEQENAYVANGDIGIIVGGYKTKNMKRRPRNLEVELNSQPGVKFTYPYWEFTGDDGSPELELAYVLTVHKTQGSPIRAGFPRCAQTL